MMRSAKTGTFLVSGTHSFAGQVLSVDVGGTFTDVVQLGPDGKVRTFKLPSDGAGSGGSLPAELVAAVAGQDTVLHSTTVAINSLLAGRIPRIGLIVTAGFRDILETARLPPTDAEPGPLPARLVALEFVRELGARHTASGVERAPLERAEVVRLADEYRAAGIDVVAVALLHSYLNPAHERALAQIFAEIAPHITVVCSSDVLPELREYERTLACALNAALMPILNAQVRAIEAAGGRRSPNVWLMQSNGRLVSAAAGIRQPLGSALSGPGAAVVGMRWLAARCGFRDVITLDIGGTSTDVALIADGRYSLTTAGEVAGFALRMPMIDVLSIGAGGGSIAHAGADKRWHVGPESAGAVPGPACYGRGGKQPTLTDAQLVLGRLPEALLGGSMALERERALDVVEGFGRARGFDAERSARGILEIATHHMCGAVRRVSVQRGRDPAAHALLAVGGAGPLHAAELATLLGITTVIVPPTPGLAAAWGLLVADIGRDFTAPLGASAASLDNNAIARGFAGLVVAADRWLGAEGLSADAARYAYQLDLRYHGMSVETSIEGPADLTLTNWLGTTLERFHAHFERLSGRSWREHEDVEVVNLRLALSVAGASPTPPDYRAQHDAREQMPAQTTRAVGFLGHPGLLGSRIVQRDALDRGTEIAGPAVIEQYESTTLVPPGWRAMLDDFDNLLLHPATPAEPG